MASSSSSSIQMTVSNEEFSCPLCLGIIDEPKLLPGCAHNFCRACLHQMLIGNHNNKVFCPVCRVSSCVPDNGADGFPTNTLLVRLLDKIPGRNEKQELLKALAACKEKIESSKKLHDHTEIQCGVIQENKVLAEQLKTQVSEYAKQTIEGITKCKETLCRKIDDFLHQKFGLSCEHKLNTSKKKIHSFLEEASNCVYSVEDILKKDDLSEILDMKTMMVEQLREFSNFSGEFGVSGKEIKAFDLEFEKFKIHNDNIFGKIVSRKVSVSGTGGDRAGSSSERSSTWAFIEAEEEINNALASCDLSAQQHQPGMTQAEIVITVNLPFEPFRIAVSPHSGDVAVLWKAHKKVYLYNSSGVNVGIISIKYGDLWDVGFSFDDNVVVLNRANNRLLFYTKENQFISQEKDVPRSGLKYTYLSVCNDGSLIVTSARTSGEGDDDDDDDDDDNDDDDDHEIVQCIIVYEHDDSTCKRMFGRKHLDRPISRAIFYNQMYYIADMSDFTCYIKIFSSQGQLVGCVEDQVDLCIVPDFMSMFEDAHSDRLFISSDSLVRKWIDSSHHIISIPYHCPHDYHIYQQEVLPKPLSPGCFRGLLIAEVYRDWKLLNIVHYH